MEGGAGLMAEERILNPRNNDINPFGRSVMLGTTGFRGMTGTMSFSPFINSGLTHPLKDVNKIKFIKNNNIIVETKCSKYYYKDGHIYIIANNRSEGGRYDITYYNNLERLHSYNNRPSRKLYQENIIVQKEWHRNGQLHREGKPARIRYTETEKKNEYFLYGVNVDREFLETPKEKINIAKELKSPNVQYRAMIFQYLGYSYIISKLKGKVIHKEIIKGMPYELIAIENIDVETVVVLKMTCPSTGVFYCERVPPTMEKCKDALAWREYDEKDYEMPEQRT